MAKTSVTLRTGTKPRLPKAVAAAVRAAHDRKGVDLVVLDLRETDAFTEYFIICTGQSSRQMTAIADSIGDALRELGERAAVVEGGKSSEWILLDYFSFVVHIFSHECRGFYDLERLWGTAVRHEIAEA